MPEFPNATWQGLGRPESRKRIEAAITKLTDPRSSDVLRRLLDNFMTMGRVSRSSTTSQHHPHETRRPLAGFSFHPQDLEATTSLLISTVCTLPHLFPSALQPFLSSSVPPSCPPRTQYTASPTTFSHTEVRSTKMSNASMCPLGVS